MFCSIWRCAANVYLLFGLHFILHRITYPFRISESNKAIAFFFFLMILLGEMKRRYDEYGCERFFFSGRDINVADFLSISGRSRFHRIFDDFPFVFFTVYIDV